MWANIVTTLIKSRLRIGKKHLALLCKPFLYCKLFPHADFINVKIKHFEIGADFFFLLLLQ